MSEMSDLAARLVDPPAYPVRKAIVHRSSDRLPLQRNIIFCSFVLPTPIGQIFVTDFLDTICVTCPDWLKFKQCSFVLCAPLISGRVG